MEGYCRRFRSPVRGRKPSQRLTSPHSCEVCAAAALAVAALLACTAPAQGGDVPDRLRGAHGRLRPVAPAAIAWAPDGRMFIAEKGGRVRVVMPDGTLSPTPLLDISSHVYGVADRGMLGHGGRQRLRQQPLPLPALRLQAAPAPSGNGARTSRLTRVTVNDNNTASAETTILGSVGHAALPGAVEHRRLHPGRQRLALDRHGALGADGTLWLGSGDGADWSRVDPRGAAHLRRAELRRARSCTSTATATGLPGHPFCPTDTDLTQVCTKLYAKGLRNPFRFTLRPGTGPVVGDVGWEKWEEIDLVDRAGQELRLALLRGHRSTRRATATWPGAPPQYANEGTPQAATPPELLTTRTRCTPTTAPRSSAARSTRRRPVPERLTTATSSSATTCTATSSAGASTPRAR